MAIIIKYFFITYIKNGQNKSIFLNQIWRFSILIGFNQKFLDCNWKLTMLDFESDQICRLNSNLLESDHRQFDSGALIA